MIAVPAGQIKGTQPGGSNGGTSFEGTGEVALSLPFSFLNQSRGLQTFTGSYETLNCLWTCDVSKKKNVLLGCQFMGAREETRRSHFLIHVHHGEIDFHHWGRQLHKLPTQQQSEITLLGCKIGMLTIQHGARKPQTAGDILWLNHWGFQPIFSSKTVATMEYNRLVKIAVDY